MVSYHQLGRRLWTNSNRVLNLCTDERVLHKILIPICQNWVLPHFAQSQFAQSYFLTLTLTLTLSLTLTLTLDWANWDWAKWEDTLN